MILAGDLGGTKCTLILFEVEAHQLRPVYRLTVKTADFPDIDSFFEHFRQRAQRDGHPLTKLSGAAGSKVRKWAPASSPRAWSRSRRSRFYNPDSSSIGR